MLNRSIEIHDSTLEKILISGNEALLHFSRVYIHQTEVVAGRDAGQVWTQAAVLRISEAAMSGSFSQFPVWLSDGCTLLGTNLLENEIPVPLSYEGMFELRLEAFREKLEVLRATGSGAQLELLGEAKYLEEFRA